jgi:hypothetical protein
MVPKADIPETPFDESSTQTNEMEVVEAASALEHRQPVIASALRQFSQAWEMSVRKISPVYAGRLIDSCKLQEVLCSLLC